MKTLNWGATGYWKKKKKNPLKLWLNQMKASCLLWWIIWLCLFSSMWNLFFTIYEDGWQQMASYEGRKMSPRYLLLCWLCAETARGSEQTTDKNYSDYPSQIRCIAPVWYRELKNTIKMLTPLYNMNIFTSEKEKWLALHNSHIYFVCVCAEPGNECIFHQSSVGLAWPPSCPLGLSSLADLMTFDFRRASFFTTFNLDFKLHWSLY